MPEARQAMLRSRHGARRRVHFSKENNETRKRALSSISDLNLDHALIEAPSGIGAREARDRALLVGGREDDGRGVVRIRLDGPHFTLRLT